VTSGGEHHLIAGDLAHHPAQVHETGWIPSFDGDGPTAVASREKVMARLESEGHPAAFCHFTGSGFGTIARDGNRRIFRAL
jgi:hypothetical protein